MALTVTKIDNKASLGSYRAQVAEVAFDASYPTGGEPLTPGDLGLARISLMLVENASGYSFEYDHTNSKLVARHFDYNAVADGPAIEVPDTTDLSAVTAVRLIAIGR